MLQRNLITDSFERKAGFKAVTMTGLGSAAERERRPAKMLAADA